MPIRVANQYDAEPVGRLLHAFNTEYEEPTPGPEALAARMELLMQDGETVILLAGDGPDGLAVLRFRLGIWSSGFECYLAELYVKPELRGHGRGRALMQAAIETARDRGADTMDLGTDETDVAAHHLYRSLGFSNQAYGDHGPIMYVYERDL